MFLLRKKITLFLTIFIIFVVISVNIHILNLEKLQLSQCKEISTKTFSKGQKRHLEITRTSEQSSYFEELACDEIFNIKTKSKELVAENKVGNRGVSLVNITYNEKKKSAVLKEAFREVKDEKPFNMFNIYKYNNAIEEVKILKKFQGYPGIPHFYGVCTQVNQINYLVEKIEGENICNDTGTSNFCADATYLLNLISSNKNPLLSALKLAYNTANVFKLFENTHFIFEDLSGKNIMINKNFNIYLADVDSFTYYGNKRVYSGRSCKTNSDCIGPVGKHWNDYSLNVIIYSNCNDLNGICENNKCRGYDASIHACGITNWYFAKLSRYFVSYPKIQQNYLKLCKCLGNRDPKLRCTFNTALKFLTPLVNYFSNNN